MEPSPKRRKTMHLEISSSATGRALRTNICAKLVTIRNGRKEVIALVLNRPVTIGRDPQRCTYVLTDPCVSGIHCKLYAIPSPTGGIIVSCHDLSRNGINVNSQRIKKTAVILMDGDVLELPQSSTFTCVYVTREPTEKSTIFDPTPPTQPTFKHLGRYIISSHCLGRGSFATVHLALDPNNHRQVACKSIKTRKSSEVEQVMKEVRILMTLTHPNINQIYETQENKNFMSAVASLRRLNSGDLTFTYSHIFLQLCTGGDLFTYITCHPSTDSRLCEAEAKYIMYQLLMALQYLHDRMISHRDLKPENILLFAPGPYPRILIADFGLARPNALQETFNVCGTVSYLPPEGILALDHKHLSYVGLPADCWSAGVILFVMLSGYHPFDNEPVSPPFGGSSYLSRTKNPMSTRGSQSQLNTDVVVKAKIIEGEVQFRAYIWKDLTKARALVEQLLIYDHTKRATVRRALESEWINCELHELQALYQQRIAWSSVSG